MSRIPSETLRTFFNECSISLEVEMMNRFKVMGAKFCDHLSAKVGGNKAHEHLRQSELLYLKVLDKIINLKRTSSAPLSENFQQEMQHRVLITCCMEIVLFSNKSELMFPWILGVFSIQPIDLLRVVWIFDQFDETFLSHDIVKHLNQIREQILESMAWRKDSTLWVCLRNEPIPSCEKIFLPSQPNITGGIITPPEEVVRGEKSKRSRFLDRFFMEFYYLASGRLQDLCNGLKLFEKDFQKKAWTCFEHLIMTNKDIMQDHHLNRIIICAIYTICQGTEIKLSDIKDFYCRMDPKSDFFSSKFDFNLGGNNDETQYPDPLDLIAFYYTVYIDRAREVQQKLSNHDSLMSFPLTALPLRRAKISFSLLTQSPNFNASLCYSINNSSSKVLKDINRSLRPVGCSIEFRS